MDVNQYSFSNEKEKNPIHMQLRAFTSVGFSLQIIHLLHANHTIINHSDVLTSSQNTINFDCYPSNEQLALHSGESTLINDHVHGKVRLEREESLIKAEMNSTSFCLLPSDQSQWICTLWCLLG